MPAAKLAPTIRDVAALAQVSVATVSRVINGHDVTRPATAERVERAIATLGFRPHGIGRSLKTARTRTLGVMMPSLANPVFAEAVTGMETAAKEAGYTLLLAATDYRNENESRAVDTLRSRGIDGLILTVADAAKSPVLDALDADGTPYVLVYNGPACPTRATVTVDNEAAGREVAERLIACGHRRLGMVAGAFATSDRSRARNAGFVAGTAAAGLEPPVLIEIDFSDMRLAGRIAPLFNTARPPTALFCSNDLVAIAVMGALRELGLEVPDDVSVVGFDGIMVGRWIAPSLATIVQPSREMGRRAVAQLLHRLSTNASPEHVILPYRFEEGRSLGRAPARRSSPTLAKIMGGT